MIEPKVDGEGEDEVNPEDYFADNGLKNPFADELLEEGDNIVEIEKNDNQIIEENNDAGKGAQEKIVEDNKPEVKAEVENKPEVKADGDIKPAAIKPNDEKALPDTLEELYGGTRPYYGKFVFTVAKATVDAAKGPVNAGDLREITNEEFNELREKAREVDITYIPKITSNNPANTHNNLVDYRATASKKFESLYPADKDKDPPIMREIKRNLFMNLAIDCVPKINVSAAAFCIKANHNMLVNEHGQGETLNLLYPGFRLKNRTLDIRTALK